MTGFKPLTSDIGSDRSTNWATTTAQNIFLLIRRRFQAEISLFWSQCDKQILELQSNTTTKHSDWLLKLSMNVTIK